MRFWLDTTGNFYDAEHAKRLEALGFRFEKAGSCSAGEFCKIPIERMDDDPEIEFADLEALVEFTKVWGRVIINDDSLIINDEHEF